MIEKCGNCGAHVDIGDKTCKNCEVDIQEFDERTKTRNFFFIIIGIAFIAIFLFLIFTIIRPPSNQFGP